MKTVEVRHPLVQHKIGLLRDASLSTKGFRELVHALSLVPDAGNLLLIGVGDSHILSVDAPFKVMQIEHVNDDPTTAAIYAAADVMAIPSRQDNLPNTILESMSCGTPVVGFASGGIPDMVRPGQTGWLAPTGDTAALRDGIRQALSVDPETRGRLKNICRRVAVEEYSLDVQAKQYAALYGSLIPSAAAPMADRTLSAPPAAAPAGSVA